MSTRQVRLATDTSGLEDDDGSVLSSSIGSPLQPSLPPPPSGTSIVKQGWLQKSDPHGSYWKQRWCVLLPHAFYYYLDSDTKDSKLKGAFELRQSKLVMGWDIYKKSPTTHVFQLQLPKRQYFFCAATAAELLEWRQAIEGVLGTSQPPQSHPHGNMLSLSSPAPGADLAGDAPAAPPEALGSSSQRVLVMEQQGRFGSWVPAAALTPDPHPASQPAAPPPAPPQPPPPPPLPTDVTFYVLLADPAHGADKRFTMVVRSDKVAALTFGKVRRNLSKAVGGGVAPERILLTVEGDSTPLEDAWSGEGLIHDRVQLRMRVLPPLPSPAPAVEDGTAEQPGAAWGAGAGAAGPSEPRTSGGSVRGGLLAATPQTQPRPLSTAASGASSRGGFRGDLSSALSSPAAAAALDRRGRLRRLFDDVVTTSGRSRGTADRAELAAALAADPEFSTAPEHEDLLRRLLGGGHREGGGGGGISWEAFSNDLEAAAAACAARDAAAAAAAAAAASVPAPLPPPGEGGAVEDRVVAPRQPTLLLSAAPPPSQQQQPPQQQRPGAAAAPAPAPGTAAVAPEAAGASSRISSSRGGLDAHPGVGLRSGPPAEIADAAAGTPAAGAGGPRHVMVIKVDVPGGSEASIHIRAGDSALDLAADFVRAHGLSADDYIEPLAEEIRKTLVDAYALELADERAAHAATRQALADAQSSSTARSDAAAEAAALRRRVAELDEQLRVAAGAAGAAAAASRAREDAEQAATALRRQVAMQRSAEEQLRSELAAAQDAAAAAQAQTRAVSETLAALEAAKRAQAWDRYVDGGAAASDHPPLPGVASDWRTWAAEKRELLERANADRSALVEENKRLRASLDTRGVDMEARLRGADHEIAQLRSELHTLAAARNQAEAELRSVYQQWEADGRRWAGERRRQTEQMEALSASTPLA